VAGFVFLLSVSQRKCAEITTGLASALAKVERLIFVAMNMRTFVFDLPRFNHFDASEALGSLSILGILKCFVPSGERSLDGLWSCIDLTYPCCGTQGATRVILAADVIFATR
jgi:hypothetical protein